MNPKVGDIVEYRAQVGEWRSVPVVITARKIENNKVIDGNVFCYVHEVTRILVSA